MWKVESVARAIGGQSTVVAVWDEGGPGEFRFERDVKIGQQEELELFAGDAKIALMYEDTETSVKRKIQKMLDT